MSEDRSTADGRGYLGRSLEIAMHLGVIGLVLLMCVRVFSAFLVPVVWGIIIAIALNPLFGKLRDALGGRAKLAATIFLLIGLGAATVPAVFLAGSVADGAISIERQLEAGTLRVPPPQEKVKQWPVIGGSLYAVWYGASVDLETTARKFAPQLKPFGRKVASAVAGLGTAFVQSLFALVIAVILMVTGKEGSRIAYAIGARLGGSAGVAMVDISTGTVRSVVKGVLLVAIIQGVLAAVGLYAAGVPFAGLWALLVMMVAVIQLPPILVLGPIAAYVFSAHDSTGIAIAFLIWSILVSASDSFLKPVFLGRGVAVPMVIILIGAIGGMLRWGVVGLFIGPVVLGIGFQLFRAWIAGAPARETPPPAAGPTQDQPA